MLEATIAYRILTSREVLAGADGLDGINTTPVNQGAVVLAAGSVFRLDRNSGVAPDGITIIAPSAGPGRWILVASANGVDISVVDLTALAALGASTPNLCWVESLKCYWHRDLASVLAPDTITVIAALGGGNWERIVPTTSLDWCAQAAWYVDPIAGDDENSGAVGAPVATFDEINRRLSVSAILQDTVITIVAGAVVPTAELEVDTGVFMVSIVGVPTVVHTGTVSNYTDRVHATPIEPRLTEAAFDFTPFERMRARITVGATAGAIAWISRANPGGAGVSVASVSRFSTLTTAIGTPTAATPVNGNTYVIESLPIIRDLRLTQRNSGYTSRVAFYVNSVFVGPASGALGTTYSATSQVVMDASYHDTSTVALLSFRASPSWKRCGLGGVVSNAITLNGNGQLLFCLIKCRWQPFGSVTVTLLSTLVDPNTTSIVGLYLDTLGAFGQFVVLDDVQIFNAAIGIHLQDVCYVNTRNGLSGNGNTIGLEIGNATANGRIDGQSFTWRQASDLPNLVGGTATIRIDGTSTLNLVWANMPFRSDEQRGVGTLTNGTATIAARNTNTRGVTVSKATPSGNPQGQLTAPTASRTATQFVVNAADAAGALVNTDQSTFDWQVPPFARNVTICEAGTLVGGA